MTSRGTAITSWLREHEGEALGFLERLVNQDSGTYDRADVIKVGDLLACTWADLGFDVQRIAQPEVGDHVLATRMPAGGDRALLCIGHMDTVFHTGTAASRPFRIVGDRATGPGVLDMKGELTVLLFALRALAATDSDALRGLSLGGERSNVVPGYASADADLRVWSLGETEQVMRAFREIVGRSTVPGATGKLSGEVSTPPLANQRGDAPDARGSPGSGVSPGTDVRGSDDGGRIGRQPDCPGHPHPGRSGARRQQDARPRRVPGGPELTAARGAPGALPRNMV